MKVFSKEKYTKVMEEALGREGNELFQALKKAIIEESKEDGEWTDKCDGKEVVNGKIDDFKICDEWCIEVEKESSKEEKTSDKKYTAEEIKKIFDEAKDDVLKASKVSTAIAKEIAVSDDSENEESFDEFSIMWDSIAKTVLKGLKIRFYDKLEGEDNESK